MALNQNLLPIEREISNIVKTRRIRISEFFKDFDRLRSGKISAYQFTRCLNQVFGSARSDDMTADEEQGLVEKYGDEDSMVDYRKFSNTIQGLFNPADMNSKPSEQIESQHEYLGDINQNITESEKERVFSVLRNLEPFYDYHGIDIRQTFEDFARHNNGRITASQFKRNFPGNDTIETTDIDLFAIYYQSNCGGIESGQLRSPLVNYLNFYLDIEELRKHRKWWAKNDAEPGNALDVDANVSKALDDNKKLQGDTDENMDKTTKSLFDRLHVAIFKNRIRTTEFFRDHDKLRSGIITRNQFIRGLTLAQDGVQLGASLLTEDEIQKIADHYSDTNDMVHYKEFCNRMENTFNIPNLEKKPTLNPVRPSPKQLQTKLTKLDEHEEDRLQQLIQDIREYVSKRRIMLYPYFKDFDRGAGYTRTVTKGQFSRILNFSKIEISPRDLDLIYRKYRDPVTGDVLYPAFTIAVEAEFGEYMRSQEDYTRYGHAKDWVPEHKKAALENQKENSKAITSQPKKKNNVVLSVDQTKAVIVEYLYANRVRGETFFKDFDPLRSGLVTKSIFSRCLDSMGITDVTPEETEKLADAYICVEKPDCVLWCDFLEDVTTLHDKVDLFDTIYGLPDEPFVPKAEVKGKTEFLQLSEFDKQTVLTVLQRFFDKVSQRRLLPKPVFQDFDQHNHGHVTLAQFRQVLCTLQLGCSEEESNTLIKLFSDQWGFDYEEFLDSIAPMTKLDTKYEGQLKELQKLGETKTYIATGVESERYSSMLPKNNNEVYPTAMNRMKTLVFKERVRVYEWMKDYDKLRSGSIPASSFRRALDLCGAGIVLVEPEIISIMENYVCTKKQNHIRYLDFCGELETVFTVPHLDKNPLCEVKQFKPPVEWERNDLEEVEETIYEMAMQRLSEHIKKTRIQLHPLFEDYDRVHNATVSRSQFHRVLSELEMGGLLSEQEFRVIFKKFNMTKGGKNDVNYVAFCDYLTNKNDNEDFFCGGANANEKKK